MKIAAVSPEQADVLIEGIIRRLIPGTHDNYETYEFEGYYTYDSKVRKEDLESYMKELGPEWELSDYKQIDIHSMQEFDDLWTETASVNSVVSQNRS